MQNLSILDENWRTLTSLFPVDWRERARQYGAVSRLCGFNSEDELMRTLLLHIAGGYSLRETVVLATSPEEVEEKDVDVGGIVTHCLIAGPLNAPHVIFVHGLGGSLATWSLNLPAFVARFRIC